MQGRGLTAYLLAMIMLAAFAGYARADSLDAFSGAELDGEGQSSYYLGLSGTKHGLASLPLSGRLFFNRLTYKFEEGGRLLEAKALMTTVSAGVRHIGGNYTLSGYAGLDLRKTEKELAAGGMEKTTDAAPMLMAELYAWGEDNKSLLSIVSYSAVDNFIWFLTRARRSVAPLQGGRHILAGIEGGAMGNRDYSAFQAGVTVELYDPASVFSVLCKGGLKDTSSLGTMPYFGLELYKAF